MLFQPPLPPMYNQLSPDELAERIRAHKSQFGRRLIILGHHYQMDEVIQHSDFTGDSFKLSQAAASLDDAEYIVFCGVHFMAESADILTHGQRTVILPDLSAGCSMADMAAIDQLEVAWSELQEISGVGNRELDTGASRAFRIVPVTYVNSSAAVKSFVGEHGGACCTSSNAMAIVTWALGGKDRATPEAVGPTPSTKLLFLPDQHLGRNTLLGLGFPHEQLVVWDPAEPNGGLTAEQVRNAVGILWKGHCSVHQLFTPQQVDAVRQADPEMKVIVHPECRFEVCQKADFVGSTEYILKTVRDAPGGTRWAVGTEIHMVNRLAAEAESAGKVVRSLSGIQCLCTTMYRIDQKHLCWVLDNVAAGRVVNQIRVPEKIRLNALVGLKRMLEHAGTGAVGRQAPLPAATQPAGIVD